MASRKAAGAAAVSANDARMCDQLGGPIDIIATLSPSDFQAVSWLARRAGLTLPVARAVAQANSWGRA